MSPCSRLSASSSVSGSKSNTECRIPPVSVHAFGLGKWIYLLTRVSTHLQHQDANLLVNNTNTDPNPSNPVQVGPVETRIVHRMTVSRLVTSIATDPSLNSPVPALPVATPIVHRTTASQLETSTNMDPNPNNLVRVVPAAIRIAHPTTVNRLATSIRTDPSPTTLVRATQGIQTPVAAMARVAQGDPKIRVVAVVRAGDHNHKRPTLR